MYATHNNLKLPEIGIGGPEWESGNENMKFLDVFVSCVRATHVGCDFRSSEPHTNTSCDAAFAFV